MRSRELPSVGAGLARADVRGGPLFTRRGRAGVLCLALALVAMFMMLSAGRAAAASPQALILGDSVSNPGPSPANPGESLEQTEAELDGFTVTVVTGTQWDAMTAAQFAAYQVLIIGDPTCGDTTAFDAAVTNESVWEPVVMSSGGNKVLIGTDPTYHTYGGHPGDKLEGNGIAFAGAIGGATGAYVDLSCAYTSSAPGTPVPLLDGLSSHGPGSFTVGGAPCAGAISIITQSGPTSGLHDPDLSGWSCSVHEFFDKFPSDYTPLALATDPSVPVTYSGTDVDTGATVSGSPYIMLSGAGVSIKSNLVLSPATQTQNTGSSATVTANLTSGGSPVSGNSVSFDITSGPNSGQTFTGTTDSSGNVPWTYNDTGGAGQDQIVATTVVSGVTEQGTAQVTWATTTTDPVINDTHGFSITCKGGCTAPLTLARFRDPDKTGDPSDYTATINWGDGSSGAGTITQDSTGAMYVSASHTYARDTVYKVTITIVDSDGPTEPVITAHVYIPPASSGGHAARAKHAAKAKHKHKRLVHHKKR